MLAYSIAQKLKVHLGSVDLTRFADGEQRPYIAENVRDKTVFVIQSLSRPVDECVMELSLIGDAIRRSAPKTMVAVVPYMGYARQDKQNREGEPVSARVIAKFLEVSMYQEVITIDLHNDAIVGFFQIPVSHLSALHLLATSVKNRMPNDSIVISPDVGGVKRARNLAYILDVPMVVMEKKRYLDRHDKSESFQIIGDVKGKHAIIIDDIISTGGTIVDSSLSLKEAGAKNVTVLATHAVFSGNAIEKLENSVADTIIVTDTVKIENLTQCRKLKQISVAQLLADAIASIIQ